MTVEASRPTSSSNPAIHPEKTPKQDTQAKQEVRALEKHKLESDKQRGEHLRQERLRNIFSYGVMVLLALVFALISGALIIVSWHYLAPSSQHWVDDDALNTVSTVLFSGTLFVFLGLYVRDRV